jgi:outer membrane protein assembly factor BamD (BamD/ComL family)
MRYKIPVAFILVFIFAMMMLSCSSIKRHWNDVKKVDSVAGYELFLEIYPNTKYSKKAQQRLEELFWNKTQQENTIAAYDEFLKRFPNSIHLSIAQKNLEELWWERAQRLQTPAAYEVFLRKYTKSKYAVQAVKGWEESAWKVAHAENTIPAYNAFLEKFPKSKYREQALKGIDILNLKYSDQLKIIRLDISQEIQDAGGLNLPLEALTRNIFDKAGVRFVSNDAKYYNATLEIKLSGTAYPAYYEYFRIENQKGKTYTQNHIQPLYTAASVTGQIDLILDDFYIEKDFTGRTAGFKSFVLESDRMPEWVQINYPNRNSAARENDKMESILNSYRRPSASLFMETLNDSGSFIPRMIELAGEVYGVKVLDDMLTEDNSSVRYWAAKSLVRKVEIEKLLPPSEKSGAGARARSKKESETSTGISDRESIIKPLLKFNPDVGEALTIEVNTGKYKRQREMESMLRQIETPPISQLIKDLSDNRTGIREKAARLLGARENDQATEALIQRLQNEENKAVKLAIVESLIRTTGQNLGTEYSAWNSWWESRGSQ